MCVFCNQRSISGRYEFCSEKVVDDIETVLSGVDRSDTEIELAFFGGSFTGIDRELMIELLTIARGYLDKGMIDSVRCSTRPDYIDEEILSILKRYGVKTIELGIQSMDDAVLSECKRGHSAEKTRRACELIVNGGFRLVGQMMIGLPGADEKSEMRCAEFIAGCGACGARVYPTVVFYGTELVSMCESGRYVPLTTEDAVRRTARVLDIFDRASVPVIRVGLCASDNLSDDSCVYAGANDAAIGEMAMSALYYERITEKLAQYPSIPDRAECTIYTSPASVSKVSEHKKKNKIELMKKYGFKSVKIVEKNDLIGYNILIDVK